MPITFMSPVNLILTVMCYTGALGWECRTQPECWSMINTYSCYERNFGDIHTNEYKQAVQQGYNIKPRIKEPKHLQVEPSNISEYLTRH